MALAPAAAASWMPKTPRPPEAPHTRTFWPGRSWLRRVAEQHAVGGGQRQRVAGRLLPGQMLGTRHQLLRLHAAELRERAVRRLIAPDPLGRREHRIAAVALLVVAVVLIAVNDDLVADLPALHLGADRPDDARGIRSGDVIGLVMHLEDRDRLAETGPDAVVVDARGPSRGPEPRCCRAPRWEPLPASSRLPAARAGRAGWSRHTSTSAHGRAAGSRRSRKGPSPGDPPPRDCRLPAEHCPYRACPPVMSPAGAARAETAAAPPFQVFAPASSPASFPAFPPPVLRSSDRCRREAVGRPSLAAKLLRRIIPKAEDTPHSRNYRTKNRRSAIGLLLNWRVCPRVFLHRT